MSAGNEFQSNSLQDDCIVCLAELDRKPARVYWRLIGSGKVVVFCSAQCRSIFDEDPAPFLRHLQPRIGKVETAVNPSTQRRRREYGSKVQA